MTRIASLLPVLIAALSIWLLTACGPPEIAAYRVAKESIPTAPSPATFVPAAPASNSDFAAPAAIPSAMSTAPMATATGAELTWTAPVNWQTKAASSMRKGSYAIAGDGGAVAEVAITAFPGDVGGTVANVNRWRGQLGLAALHDADVSDTLTHVEVNTLSATWVDFANPGAAPSQRIVGAMIPFGGATWFFKLTGPEAVVAHAKPAFLEFLQTVKPVATP